MKPGTPRPRWRPFASVCLLLPLALTAVAGSLAASGTDRVLPSPAQVKAELRHAYAERARHGCAPQAPLEARLDFATRPAPGVPARLVFSVLPAAAMRQAQIAWTLPQGVRGTAPATAKAGPLAAGALTQFETRVTFSRPGEYVLTASILDSGPEATWGREARLWVRVDRGGFAASPRPFTAAASGSGPAPIRVLPPGAVVTPSPVPLPPNAQLPLPGGAGMAQPGRPTRAAAPRAQGTITISGKLVYAARHGGYAGAFGSLVQLWDRDYGGIFDGDDLLGETLAGPDGSFSFEVENTDDGRAGDRQDPYLVFKSENSVVRVFKPEFGDPVFTSQVDLPENIEDGNLPSYVIDGVGPGKDKYYDDGDEGAWELVDTLSRGWIHYYEGLGFYVDLVNVAWKPGYDPRAPNQGAYYEGIYKRITLADGQHNDPSVVLHEFGHHVLQVVKDGQIFWGEPHSFTDHASAHLAWFEGWATYSGQVSLGYPTYEDFPGFNGGGTLVWNIEQRTGTPPGETIESSVCGALWDLADDLWMDPHPHDFVGPNSGGGENAVWDCVLNSGHLNSILDFKRVWLEKNKTLETQIDWVLKDHHVYPFEKASTYIEAPDKQSPAGQNMAYPIRLKRSTDGQPLAAQRLKITLNNGTPYEFDTDADGLLDLTVTPGVGVTQATLKAEYAGNDVYHASSATALLTWGNSTLELSTPDVELGRTATWTATLKSNGQPVGGRKLYLYVAGRYVGAKTTSSSGKVTLTQPSPKSVVEVPFKVEFRGDASYSATTREGIARWVKAPVNITIPGMTYTQGKKATLKAYIERATDKKGIATESKSPERTVQVEFRVDGSFAGYGRILGFGSKGSGNTIFEYTIPSTMSVGQHTLEVKFPGSVNYHAGSGSGKFNVKAAKKKKGKAK